jgi:5-methylcytosine-specific restriction endonuclease McrA
MKSTIGGKTPRLRLDSTSYSKLHQQVLERDSWRCQVCGSMQQLQVHHLKRRSQSGSDVEQNLITLCAECHEQVHRKAWRKERLRWLTRLHGA